MMGPSETKIPSQYDGRVSKCSVSKSHLKKIFKNCHFILAILEKWLKFSNNGSRKILQGIEINKIISSAELRKFSRKNKKFSSKKLKFRETD